MGLYNLIFGKNPMSDLLLATIGLTQTDCGRFRDCFISDGTIAVYTRNGGGNRCCWHEDGDWYANEECKHESRVQVVPEVVEATEEEAKAHPDWTPRNVYIGSKRQYETPNKVNKTQYRCLEPNSAECSCPGCTIEYRLPKNPYYLRDEDDDFDSTYATIYFRFPDEFADDLKKLDSGVKFEPDERWLKALEAIKSMPIEAS